MIRVLEDLDEKERKEKEGRKKKEGSKENGWIGGGRKKSRRGKD